MNIIRHFRPDEISPLVGRNVLAVMKEGDYYYGRIINVTDEDVTLGECLQGNGSVPLGAKVAGVRNRKRKGRGRVRAVGTNPFPAPGMPDIGMPQPVFDPYDGARPIGTYTARYADLAYLLTFPLMF